MRYMPTFSCTFHCAFLFFPREAGLKSSVNLATEGLHGGIKDQQETHPDLTILEFLHCRPPPFVDKFRPSHNMRHLKSRRRESKPGSQRKLSEWKLPV